MYDAMSALNSLYHCTDQDPRKTCIWKGTYFTVSFPNFPEITPPPSISSVTPAIIFPLAPPAPLAFAFASALPFKCPGARAAGLSGAGGRRYDTAKIMKRARRTERRRRTKEFERMTGMLGAIVAFSFAYFWFSVSCLDGLGRVDDGTRVKVSCALRAVRRIRAVGAL